MVESQNLPGVPLPVPVGLIRLGHSEGNFKLTLDGAAYDDRKLLAVSGCAGSTEVRAFRAGLFSEDRVSFRLEPAGSGFIRREHTEEGYRVWCRSMGYNVFHLVAVTRDPTFLPTVSEDAVWRYLTTQTTTPLDRRWMPTLMEELRSAYKLYSVNGLGFMNPGRVSVTDQELDDMVRNLVRRGHVRLSA